jgi:phage terminase large subunit
MGRKPIVLTQTSVEEGIKAARMMFPRCYFDQNKTGRLLECLKRYQRALNKAGEGNAPLHDEYSHGADAFRYVGMSVEHMYRAQQAQPVVQASGNWAPLDREIGY